MAPPNINFIQHLNNFIKVSQQDKRLTGNHMSLYLALFSIWNQNYFSNPFEFSRKRALSISHIGSKNTYSKCLKDLASWGYIEYIPSTTKGRLSSASILSGSIRPKKDTGVGPDMGPPGVKNDTAVGSNMGHIINNTNKVNNESAKALPPSKKMRKPENLEEVIGFFHLIGHPESEAAKFFNHYDANDWRQAGRVPLRNWQAAARKWILNIYPKQTSKNGKRKQQPGNLHVNQNKSYSNPL